MKYSIKSQSILSFIVVILFIGILLAGVVTIQISMSNELNDLYDANSNILSLNEKGQLVDQQGNIVSHATYETLPEGYKYVLGDDGIIKVVLIDDTTSLSENEDNNSTATEDNTRKIIIIVSSVTCVGLVFALILTLILTKKNRNKKTADSKTKARKAKEKAKKAKFEAKEARKQSKKK